MSSSSLYGSTGNVTVSTNNLTTLYNSTGGNVVTANVPDRDFTTLYTKQSDIKPTLPYGNSNVESFLNNGTDGANTVQNIKLSGNITVGGHSLLGNVSNVVITGGSSGYVLTTDGEGNLIWAEPEIGGNQVPYIHFDVVSTGSGQSFTNSNLNYYANSTLFSLFKNGVNIEPTFYTKTANNTVQVNILLNTGDTIDILPSAGAGGLPAGIPQSVQYNNGYTFAGSSNFLFNEDTNTLTVSNGNVGNLTAGNFTIQEAANLTIGGGFANWVLATDGLGNVSWIEQATSNGHPAGSNTQVQFNSGANTFAASIDFTYNSFLGELHAPQYIGNGYQLSHINASNVVGIVANATYADSSNISNFSTQANIANVANSVNGSNVVGSVGSSLVSSTVSASSQPAITSVGNLTSLTSNGIVNFTNASNVSFGSPSTVHISGGTANYFLQTDGAGNLTWASAVTSGGTPGGANTNIQFNDAGTFGGNVNFYYNKTTSLLRSPNIQADTLVNLLSAEEHAEFAGGVTGTYTYDTTLSSVVLCTTNTLGNFTLNFTNLTMNTNGVRSFAFINKNNAGATYHCTGISIGGVSQTVNWLGGSAPTSGGQNDIYNITIIKTSGTPTYTVFVSIGGF